MSRVLIAGPADAQIEAIDAWWRANRSASPSLFAEQLLGAFDLLESTPAAGTPYPHAVEGVRRLSLRTGHALYYVVRGDYVTILAVNAPHEAPEIGAV